MKYFLSWLLFLFCALQLEAQSFCKNQNPYTASGAEPGSDLAPTPDGGFVLCGAYWGPTPNYDIAVQKFGAGGNLQWSNAYGYTTGSTEYSGSIAVTTNKEYVVVGGSLSDLFVVRMDSTGVVQWSQIIEDTGATGRYGADVVGTMDNGCAIAGQYTVGNSPRMYVVKLDSTGAIQWTAIIEDSVNVYGLTASEDAQGNILVSGYKYGTPTQFSKDLVVAKISPSGNVLWSYQYHSALGVDNYRPGALICVQNNYYVSGYLDTSLNSGLYSIGFLIKMDTAGNVLWSKATNEPATSVRLKDMYLTQQNTFIFAGMSITAPGNYRGMILETDTAFNPLWYSVNNEPYFTDNRGVAQTTNGNYILSGCYDSASYVGFTVTGISNHVHCCGSPDNLMTFSYTVTRSPVGTYSVGGWISPGSVVNAAVGYHTFCNSEVGIVETQSSSEELTVYPNPGADEFSVTAQQTILRYELINLQGQVILSSEVNSPAVKIDVAGLPNGIYVLTVYTQEGVMKEKVEIVR